MAEHPTANGVSGASASGAQFLDTLHGGRVPRGPAVTATGLAHAFGGASLPLA